MQSHLWLTASSYCIWLNICVLPHTQYLGSPSSYMTLKPLPSEFPYNMRKISFSFLISVGPEYYRNVNKEGDQKSSLTRCWMPTTFVVFVRMLIAASEYYDRVNNEGSQKSSLTMWMPTTFVVFVRMLIIAACQPLLPLLHTGLGSKEFSILNLEWDIEQEKKRRTIYLSSKLAPSLQPRIQCWNFRTICGG